MLVVNELVVNELEVSIVFAFDFHFKSFFGEHSTYLSHAWIPEPRHLPKEGKKGQVSTQYHERGETYNLTN